MDGIVVQQTAHEDFALRLVYEALGQDTFRGLGSMLACVAGSVGAWGCILWQLDFDAQRQSAPADATLSVVAQWFSTPPTHMVQNLTTRSIVGTSILTASAVQVDDPAADKRVHQGPFLLQNHIAALCSVPLCFNDGTPGALCAYKREKEPFTAEAVDRLERLARLVPGLYQTIRDKVGLRLVTQVSRVLHHTGQHPPPSSYDQIKKTLLRTCELLSETFENLETSIFLEDPAVAPGVYQLQATTWKRDFQTPTRRVTDPGLTAWTLKHGAPVRVFDLKNFHANADKLDRQYPGITWVGSLGVVKHLREYLNIKEYDETPPVGFMSAPVMIRGQVLGVVRCSARKIGPYAFGASDLALLEVIAAEIASVWTKWLSDRDIEAENQTWRDLVSSVSEFNRWMHDELHGGPLDKRAIFAEGLRMHLFTPPFFAGQINFRWTK